MFGGHAEPMEATLFEVKILYREPLHELWSGGVPEAPFVARYRSIEADSHSEAARIAETRFEAIARESRARWPRVVLEVRVRPQG
jgi:hypothetical protein